MTQGHVGLSGEAKPYSGDGRETERLRDDFQVYLAFVLTDGEILGTCLYDTEPVLA